MNSQIQRKDSFWLGIIIPVIISLGLLLFLYFGIEDVASTSSDKGLEILEQAVNRAVVQCYAIEGMYPPDIHYLEEHYGLVYDHERYIIHYEVFASNILPDFTVIDLK